MKLIRLLKRELASEALRWVERDLISRDQAKRILALYDAQLPAGDQSTRGYNILMTFAALFVGLAFIVLVSANWEEIPRAVRMVGLIALTVSANWMGIRAFSQERNDAGVRWFFLGAILYGTSIMLIAQIYHLGEHYPDGIYWWVIGVLPLALLTRSIVLMLLVQLLSTVWFFTEIEFEVMPWSFLVFVGCSLYFAHSLRTSVLVFLAAVIGGNMWLAGLAMWWMGRAQGGLASSFENGVLAMACGIASVMVGTWMEKGAERETAKIYGGVLRLWGLRGAVILLLTMSFEGPWQSLFEERFSAVLWLWISLAIGLGSWLGALGLSLKQGLGRQALLGFAWSGVCVVFWAAAMLTVAYFDGDPLSWQVAGNLLAVVCGIAFVIEAVQETSTSSFYMGVGMLLLLAFFRYFDLVGDYLGTAILFMVCAGILMAAARFWRRFSAQAQAQEQGG